jgi:putative ABC transport system permease protein
MSTIARGIKGAVRNPIRTIGVTVILALSVGLALVMLLSLKTVQARISSVKASIGNTISISPAGSRGFEGGGEPLTQADITSVKSLAHIASVKTTLNDRLTPTTDTSLASAIDAGSLGNRAGRQNSASSSQPEQPQPPANAGGSSVSGATRTFTIPIMVSGVTEVDASSVQGGASSFKFTSGKAIDATSSAKVANIGAGLAAKNNLKVGGTFTAYSGATFTVAGIYDAGNTFANAGIIMPLATVQALSGQAGQISSATVTVDEITNVSAAVKAVQDKLGTKADVTSQQDQATSAIAPLENIKTISLYSLVGSLVAGSIIIFLTMLMIVRERRREIGVLKAIGSSNIRIVGQFVTEALTLTLAGSVIGVVGGVLLSNPILKLLIANSAVDAGGSGPGGGFGRGAARVLGLGGQSFQNLQAVVGYDILLYGLGVAILIAVLGSALPAFAIAKVRPAEVMRGE